VAQAIFLPNFKNLYVKKSCPKFEATSVIFKKLSKENNRPMGENSPYLVTLLVA
jgi:hypothetical protein